MPPQNPDQLDIGVGLSGFENVEARIERLNTLLETVANTADRAFTRPSSSTKDLAVRLAELDRSLATLATKYASFGRAGAAGFDLINKAQLETLEKIGKLQAKLRDLDERRGKSRLVSELAEITKEAKNVETQLEKLTRASYSLQTLDVTAKLRGRIQEKPGGEKVVFSGPASVYRGTSDPELQKAIKDADSYATQRKRYQQEYDDLVNRGAEREHQTRTRQLQNFTKDRLSALGQIAKEEAKITLGAAGRYIGRSTRGGLHDVLAEFGLGGLSGVLGPAAAVGAAVYGLKQLVDIGALAIDRASEQARANRTLAASAAEAGVAFGDLNKANKEFAQLTALSDVKATSTVAKITQLATLTKDPGRIFDSTRPDGSRKPGLTRAFADLGAARGLDAQGIETVVQQIITGQDEGYKKLLLPNPSQLQKQYADANQRTVGSLTAVEKAKIFQDAFLKKAELFNGAAEQRLKSVDGRAAALKASFENLANTLSTRFANNYDVATFFEGLTKDLNRLNVEIDDLSSKVERGINIDKLVKAKSDVNELQRGASIFLGTIGLVAGSFVHGIAGGLVNQAAGKKVAYAPFEEGLNQTSTNLYGSIFGQDNSNREDFTRQQVNAELFKRSTDRKIQLDSQVRLAKEQAEEDQKALADKEKLRLTAGFKTNKPNVYDVTKAIDQIKEYQSPLAQSVSQKDVADETLNRYNKRDQNLDLGRPQAQIMSDLANQVLKEKQAAIEVLNQPLFSEKDKDLLIKEGEDLLEKLSKKAREMVDNLREDLTSNLADKTDNPLVKLLSDAENAAENARKKFAELGPELAKQAGQFAELEAKRKVAIAEFESSDRELGFRQQARQEQQRPLTQTNAFERRLSRVTTEADFVGSQLDVANQTGPLDFYSSPLAPAAKTRKIREAYLRQTYGDRYSDLTQGARGTRDEKDQYREIGVKIKEGLTSIREFSGISTQGLGVYGRGAIASSLLNRLPTEEELLSSLRVPGRRREEAQSILGERSSLLKDVGADRQQRFKDFIQNQKFIDLNRQDATERAKNLFDKGGALPDKAKLDKFLNITSELGPGELTPELRDQRIKALNARADIEKNEKDTAATQLKTISDFANAVQKQVEGSGLKVTLAETPIVTVNVNASGVDAELESKGTQRTK